MKKILTKNSLLIFILMNIFFVIFYLYSKHTVGNDSSISEWFINFQGGFTRRGIGGEMSIFLSRFLDLTLRQSIFLIQATVHTTYLLLIYYYFKNVKFNILQLFAFYAPIYLLYPIAELEVLGRKEILLFLFFLTTIIFSQKKYDSKIINAQIFFVAPIICLLWEQVVLFFPFFAAVVIIKNNCKDFNEALQKLIIIFFPSILTFLYIFFNPLSTAGNEVMCEYLLTEFGEPCYMSAAVLTTYTIHFDTFWIHNEAHFEHYFRYVLIFLVGFMPLNILISKNNFIKKDNFISKNLKLRSLFFILYSPSLLLFMYGYDWGRWVNITYSFSILFYFYLVKNSIITNNLKIKNLLWKKIVNKGILISLIFFLFAFFWNPKTVITGDIATNSLYKIFYNSSKRIFSWDGIKLFQNNPIIKFHKNYVE